MANSNKNNVEEIKPQNIIWTRNKTQVVFDLRAWKDDSTIENTDCIISVEQIFFEDEN